MMSAAGARVGRARSSCARCPDTRPPGDLLARGMEHMGFTTVATPARRASTAAALALPLLAGCSSDAPQSWLNAQGPASRAVIELFWPITIAAIIVFIFVQGLIIYSVIKYRARPDGPEAQQFHGNLTVELGSTIITALVFIVVLAMTVNTQRVLSAPLENPKDALTIKVIGHQWWWEFQYPDDGIVTGSDMVIPTGKPIIVEITSVDVIHSFWVPMLAGKMDAIPGRNNRMYLEADREGVYSAQCAEFCGIEHALMRFDVVALAPDAYEKWRTVHKTAPAEPSTTSTDPSIVLQARGAQLFQAGACKTCHAIDGTAANGKVGPNLTYFAGRTSVAGKTLPNTVENVKAWLRNPQAIKPGSLMPNLNLKEEEVDALTAYLCRPIDPSVSTGCQVPSAAKK
jgi:cytochrome c oxidase subunit II